MSTGFVPPRFEDSRAFFVSLWKTAFGENADVSSDSVDGLSIDIWTLFAQKNWEAIAEGYNQHNLGTATGLNVDAILEPLFGIARKKATKTTCEVWLYGTAGTLVPALSSVATVDTAAQFQTTADVTIAVGTTVALVYGAVTSPTTILVAIGAIVTPVAASGTPSQVAASVAATLAVNANVITAVSAGLQPDGQAIVLVQMTSPWTVTTTVGAAWRATVGFSEAIDSGPTIASYGTLTSGASGTGWEGLTNVLDATLGTRDEKTADYKLRHREAVSGRAITTSRGLAQKLLLLPGVTAVRIYQNTKHYEVDGRPMKSFEAIVVGGSQTEIAEAIWLCHPTGIASFGTTPVVVIDEQGLEPQPRTINFSRQVDKYVHIHATITRGEGFPLLPLTDIQSLVGKTLEAWGNMLGLGRDAYRFEIAAKIGSVLAGISMVEVLTDTTLTPGGAPTLAAGNIIIGDRDYSRWSQDRISVTIL